MTSPDPTPRRGRRPSTTAAEVVDAALAILDRDGLQAVSFRRVAADLGVSHMTLYGYFPSKDALLEALVARTIAVPAIEAPASSSWPEALVNALVAVHDALAARPGVAELLVGRELTGDWIAGPREQLLDLLRDAGFDEDDARDGVSILFNYVLGAVMIDVRRTRGGSAPSFARGLRYLVDGLAADAPG